MLSSTDNATQSNKAQPTAAQFIPNPESFETILESTALLLICTCNIIGNTCVIAAIFRSKKLREQTGNFLIASLAVSDGFVMSSVMMFRFSFLIDYHNAIKACDGFSTLLVIAVYSSILHLFLLSCDRYIAVFFPLRYQTIVTLRRICFVVIPAWVLPAFSLVIPPMLLYDRKKGSAFRSRLINCPATLRGKGSSAHQIHHTINTTLFLVIPFGVIVVLHGMIAKVSYYQANRVLAGEYLSEREQMERAKRIKALKWAKTIGIVIGAFVLAYVPSFACSLIATERGPSAIPRQVLTTLLVVIFLNSPLNSVIYSFRSREYRNELKRILGIFQGVVRPTANVPGVEVINPSVQPHHLTLSQQGRTNVSSVNIRSPSNLDCSNVHERPNLTYITASRLSIPLNPGTSSG